MLGPQANAQSGVTELKRLRPQHTPRDPFTPTPSPGQPEGVSLGQLWGALRENVRTILRVGVLFALAVMGLTLAQRMQFSAEGRLYLGELQGAQGSGGNQGVIDLSSQLQGDIGSEIEILRSQSLLRTAVLESGINVAIAPLGWSSPRYGSWLLSRRDSSLLDAGEKTLVAKNTYLTKAGDASRTYQVTFRDSSHYVLSDEEGATLGEGALGEALSTDGLHLFLLAGDEAPPEGGAAFELTIAATHEAIREIRQDLDISWPRPVTQGEMSKVVNLRFTDPSPRAAAQFLRVLMHAYLDERQTWKVEEASSAEAFVTRQLASMRASMAESEERLANFRTNSPVVLDDEAKALVEQIGKYEEQRVAARLELAALSDVQRALSRPDSPVEAYLFGEAQDAVLQDMASSLTEARQRLTDLESRYNEAAPDVREQRAQVAAQLKAIRAYVGNRRSRARENLATFNGIIQQFEAKLRSVPGAELGLAQLARESEVYSRLYSFLLERQQQAAISKASKVSKNRILDEPEAPVREYSPTLRLRLALALLGFLIGAAFVIARRVLSGTLQSEADIRALGRGVPVFAGIPRQAPVDNGESPIATLVHQPFSGFAEAFRLLRTHLYLSPLADEGRVIVLTSPSPGDGKTTSALALAGILCADGKRVLLIDGDLRKPCHHEMTHSSLEPGLAEVLNGSAEFAQSVTTVSTPGGQFHAMPAGVADLSGEPLAGDAFGDLIRYARLRYDYVVCDSPAFPLLSDSLTMAAHADAVLSVLRVQHTAKRLAAEHIERLSLATDRYALIANGVPPTKPYGASERIAAANPGRVSRSFRVRPRKPRVWLLAAAFVVGIVGALVLELPARNTSAPPPLPTQNDAQADATGGEQPAMPEAAASKTAEPADSVDAASDRTGRAGATKARKSRRESGAAQASPKPDTRRTVYSEIAATKPRAAQSPRSGMSPIVPGAKATNTPKGGSASGSSLPTNPF